MAVAYDVPIPGYDTLNTNSLRTPHTLHITLYETLNITLNITLA